MGEAVELAIILTARDAASGVLGNVAKKFGELGAAGKLAVAGIGAVVGGTVALVGGLTAMADKSASAAGEVKRLARETGLTALESSKLLYAGHKLGLDTDALSATFKKFSTSLVTNADEYKALGIEITKNKQGNIDFSATLGNVADKFKSLPDGAEKSALAVQLFGKRGLELLPFLNKGADGLKELGAEAARLGLVFDDKALAAATRYRLAQKQLGEDIEGIKNQIGMAFLPVLADLATALLGLAERYLPSIMAGVGRFRDGIGIAIGVVKDMVAAFSGQMTGGGDFLSGIIGPTGAANFMGLVKNVGEALGRFHNDIVTPLFNYIKTNGPGWLDAVGEAIGKFWTVAGPLLATIGGTLNHWYTTVIRPAFEWLKENVPPAWDAISAAIKTAWDNIRPKLEALEGKLQGVQARFEALPEPVKKAMEETAAAVVIVKATGIDDWAMGVANAIGGAGGIVGAIVKAIEHWKALAVAFAIGSVVTVAIALVGVAIYQVASIIGEVRDDWDKFVFALKTGMLNSIPLFGGLFQAIQGLLVAIALVQVGWRDFLQTVENVINGVYDLVNPLWTKLGNPPLTHIKIDLPNVDEAIRTIDLAAHGRITEMSVRVPNIANAEDVLAHIARERIESTPVRVPNIADAEYVLNNIARDRTANIYSNVIGSAPDWWSGGPGRPMAAGGDFITKGPQLLLVGEAGRERVQVTPLANGTSNSGGGGDTYLTVNVGTVDSPDRIRQIADAIQNLLSMDARRSGITGEALAR